MTNPEFSRPLRVDAIGEVARHEWIEADAAERAALARRFDLVSIDRLSAELAVGREGGAIVARGRIDAAVVQSCAATAQPVPATVDEAFALRFVPAAEFAATPVEVELGEADCDVVTYESTAIDLGEAVAETLALALDPFPRAPGADAALAAAGVANERVTDEQRPGPFARLAILGDGIAKPS